MQIFNQTLQQANKGSKRPIEDLFSDQELLLSQEKKHKRLKRSPISTHKEQNAWQINFPRDSNCLFLSATLSYLIPVKDNINDFRDRFDKLFLEREQQAIDEDKLNEIRVLIQEYNHFLGEKTYDNETLKELVQQFHKKAVGFAFVIIKIIVSFKISLGMILKTTYPEWKILILVVLVLK